MAIQLTQNHSLNEPCFFSMYCSVHLPLQGVIAGLYAGNWSVCLSFISSTWSYLWWFYGSFIIVSLPVLLLFCSSHQFMSSLFQIHPFSVSENGNSSFKCFLLASWWSVISRGHWRATVTEGSAPWFCTFRSRGCGLTRLPTAAPVPGPCGAGWPAAQRTAASRCPPCRVW